MASTTLNQFKQLFPASATPSKLSTGKVLITVKLEPYWGNNTVDDLTTLVNSFGVPGSHLHLYNVQKGCIAATWLCPAVDFKELRGTVEAADSLESKGVLRVFAGEGEIMWERSQPDQGIISLICERLLNLASTSDITSTTPLRAERTVSTDNIDSYQNLQQVKLKPSIKMSMVLKWHVWSLSINFVKILIELYNINVKFVPNKHVLHVVAFVYLGMMHMVLFDEKCTFSW